MRRFTPLVALVAAGAVFVTRGAMAQCQETRRKDPWHEQGEPNAAQAASHNKRGMTLLQGDVRKAVEEFEQAVRLNRSLDNHLLLLNGYLQAGRRPTALNLAVHVRNASNFLQTFNKNPRFGHHILGKPLLEIIEELQKGAASFPKLKLQLENQVNAPVLTIDGRIVPVDQDTTVDPGEHRLCFSEAGKVTRFVTVDVGVTGSTTVRVALEPKPSKPVVDLESNVPAEVEAKIDGTKLVRGKITLTGPKHKLDVSVSGTELRAFTPIKFDQKLLERGEALSIDKTTRSHTLVVPAVEGADRPAARVRLADGSEVDIVAEPRPDSGPRPWLLVATVASAALTIAGGAWYAVEVKQANDSYQAHLDAPESQLQRTRDDTEAARNRRDVARAAFFGSALVTLGFSTVLLIDWAARTDSPGSKPARARTRDGHDGTDVRFSSHGDAATLWVSGTF